MNLLKLETITPSAENASVIYFPGGPGFSWHCFRPLISALDLQGTIYGLSYTNPEIKEEMYFEELKKELTNIIQKLPNPILITHSFSSMLLLSMQNIPDLKGLVLISPASSNIYVKDLPARLNAQTTVDVSRAAAEFWLKPSDPAYKNYTKAFSPFYFNPHLLEVGQMILNFTNFSYKPYVYFVQNFLPNYTKAVIPNLPTLIIFGEKDPICPPILFNSLLTAKSHNVTTETIINAGHFPWVDALNDTTQTIQTWYKRVFGSITKTS